MIYFGLIPIEIHLNNVEAISVAFTLFYLYIVYGAGSQAFYFICVNRL